jgi:hypothetical protein
LPLTLLPVTLFSSPPALLHPSLTLLPLTLLPVTLFSSPPPCPFSSP